MKNYINILRSDGLVPSLTTHHLENEIRNGSVENPTLVKDIIKILRHCAAENREDDNFLCLVSLPNGGFFVSGSIYKWSLNFHAIVTSSDLIDQLTDAVNYNISEIQPNILNHFTASKNLSSARASLIRQRESSAFDYARNEMEALYPNYNKYYTDDNAPKNYETSCFQHYLNANPLDEFLEKNLKKEQIDYEETYKNVWVGAYAVHPKTYLQNLGVTSFPSFCS